eukprot:CAMPEP_0202978416 /NCGR_PEP_ID=MMETSP1396-20130829/84845_1 /ASSEMBLY_ACC=CAM_ASM_000872 /TAXON_ID= /ORGANISM="Pseudokeronopsis sp., Strain Brazil" /LENGTH=109 /DNA_ID=CAMNT_0049717375 /DNA_START=745 /DNA_END=1074 /DNA_ORIENTATION=-
MRKKDYKSTDLFLKYLKAYSLDMHSREIVDLVPQFIEKQLPEIGPYLETRMQESEQCGPRPPVHREAAAGDWAVLGDEDAGERADQANDKGKTEGGLPRNWAHAAMVLR